MSLTDQLHAMAIAGSAELKPVFHYLTAHPMLQYGVVTALVALTGVVIVSAPKKKSRTVKISKSSIDLNNTVPSSKDMSAIAGEDVMTTQLDLAKAYIEMGKQDQAKRILKNTLNTGNALQKTAAKQLLESLPA